MKGVESRKQIQFHRMHTLKIIALAYNVDREESRRCFLEENFIIYLSFMMFIILVLINLVIFFFCSINRRVKRSHSCHIYLTVF